MEETVLYAVLNVLSVVENESILFKITGRILPRLLSINEETLYRNTKVYFCFNLFKTIFHDTVINNPLTFVIGW